MSSRPSASLGCPPPARPAPGVRRLSCWDDEQAHSPTPAGSEADEDRNDTTMRTNRCTDCRAYAKDMLNIAGFADPFRVFPVLKWLPRYTSEQAVGDLIAGLTVGTMVVPQGMAYASIAGLPVVYGLYSAFMGCIVYMLMGTSKDVTIGPTALISLIVSHSFTELARPPPGVSNLCSELGSASYDYDYCCFDGEDYYCTPIPQIVACSLVAGVLQVVLGLLNFGFIVDFIGFPVLNGFTTAAAVTIFTSQLKHIFGLSNIPRGFQQSLKAIFENLGDTRWQDFVMGIVCMALTYYLERLKARYNARRKDSRVNYLKWLCGTSRNLLVVFFAGCVSRIIAIDHATTYNAYEDVNGTSELVSAGEQGALRVVGPVPSGVPDWQDPIGPARDAGAMGDVYTAAIVIGLLAYLESIAIGKAFAQKNGYVVDSSQELRALGVANVLTAFVQGYPVTGSFSRTAVNAASDVATPAGGLVTAVFVLIALVAFTPAFEYIPKAALAAIIMMSVVHMVDIATLRRIVRTHPKDGLVWLTSFGLCLFWNLEFGVLVAVGVSICITLYNSASLRLARMRRDHSGDTPVWRDARKYRIHGLAKDWAPAFTRGFNEYLVLRPAGFLEFPSANKLRANLETSISIGQSTDITRHIILDMSAADNCDVTATLMLENLLLSAKPQEAVPYADMDRPKAARVPLLGVRLHMVGLQAHIATMLEAFGLVGGDPQLGEWKFQVHQTVANAVAALKADASRVEALYPYRWMAPRARPADLEPGTSQVGRDARQWEVSVASGAHFWKRADAEAAAVHADEAPPPAMGQLGLGPAPVLTRFSEV